MPNTFFKTETTSSASAGLRHAAVYKDPARATPAARPDHIMNGAIMAVASLSAASMSRLKNGQRIPVRYYQGLTIFVSDSATSSARPSKQRLYVTLTAAPVASQVL